MKIAIVGIVGVPANYGGFESLVENLLDHNENSFEFTIFCSTKAYKEKSPIYKNAKLKYIPLEANGMMSIFYDGYSLISCIGKNFDLILLLGVSGAIFLPIIKPLLQIPIICNIDGIEWKRNKWSKGAQFFLRFSESFAIRYCSKIITDNKGISDYVQSQYKIKTTTIAYGASIDDSTSNYLLKKYDLNKSKYFFKVCRIEPENNIELILKVFSELNEHHLVLVGNWDKSLFGRKMKAKYSVYSNITLIDPIYNQTELNELRLNCKAYIHGHSAGGTNPSLIEAMGLGLPIISFDVNFNRYTLENNGIFFKTEEDLKLEINQFEPSKFAENLLKIKKTFTDNYTQKRIALQYAQLFLHFKQ